MEIICHGIQQGRVTDQNQLCVVFVLSNAKYVNLLWSIVNMELLDLKHVIIWNAGLQIRLDSTFGVSWTLMNSSDAVAGWIKLL